VPKRSTESQGKPRGGLALLRQVYDELYQQLGEDFSPAELLSAAQTLIEVSDYEYGLETYQDGQTHPGYYSLAVDNMISSRQWWVLRVEAMADDLQEEYATSILERAQNLKRLYNPDPYYHRG
jgi:hypothetical protein